MHHYAVRIKAGFALRTWEELLDLWNRIAGPCAGARAVCLMFTHIHALHDQPLEIPLGRALSGHTRAMRRSGVDFPGWERVSHDGIIVSKQKLRRSIRYVVLNPCRARIVACPLEWPFSSHRDSLGLVRKPIRERVREPADFHRYVSSDPSVHVQGTDFPAYEVGQVDLFAIEAAVSDWLRVPVVQLRQRGPARSYFMGTARRLGQRVRDIARHCGVTSSAVSHAPLPSYAEIERIRYLLCDRRFTGIGFGWL